MNEDLHRDATFDERTTRRWRRLRERSESTQALVEAVLGTSAQLLDARDPESLCRSALAMAADLLALAVCRIAVLRDDGRTVDLYTEATSPRGAELRTLTDPGLVSEAFRCRELTLLDRARLSTYAHPVLDEPVMVGGISTVALLPLWGAHGRMLGALLCGTRSEWGFNEHETVSLRMFGLHLGSALELMQARRDLRHWNALVQSSHAAILGKDLQGHITHWNPAAERLYGYTVQEALGRHVEIIVPEERRNELSEIFTHIAGGETTEVETVRMHKDGRRIDVALTVSPIRDATGRVIGASTVARDITEKKREHELFHRAVESAPSAMVLIDSDDRVLLANAEAERLFDRTRDELARASVSNLLVGYARIRDRALGAECGEERPERAMSQGYELWARTADGTRVPVQVGLNTIRSGDRRMILASIVDISQRKEQEYERQRLLKEAQRAVAARDTFLSIASHELKTPLTALQLTTQGLLRASRRAGQVPLGERVRDKLERMNRQVIRLGTLIDQLLDVSNITAGRLKLEPSRIDLDRLVREVVERFEHFDGAPPTYLGVERPVWGIWDPGRVDQILTNVVANAVKYGEGKPIDVELRDEAEAVILSVRDRGKGIDAKDQARIFERFERLVSHRNYGGFGLGLWIVRQLVDSHGGRIEVESQEGTGSTFRITLPKWHLGAEPLRVAIVVDDDATAATVRARVERVDPRAEVRVAGDVQEGPQLLESFSPHVVFCGSLSSDSSDGLGDYVRAAASRADLFVVAMTESPGTATRVKMRELGADRVVHRPTSVEEVRSVLAEYGHRVTGRSSVYRFGVDAAVGPEARRSD